jgi:RNA polymerase sigma-70 factor (ECF subfamily)
MPDDASDKSLFNLWQGGDQGAAQKLFERYVERLVTLARRRISERLAGRVDAEDVVQSVFRTFFVRAREGKFTVNDPDDVCKILARITVNKALRQVEFHQAAKRNVATEAGQAHEERDRLYEVLDKEPTPEAANQFLDQLERFMGQLAPEERQILELRLQGYSSEEIASQLGTYDRKIRRVMERIRGVAEKQGLAEGMG